MQCEGAVAAVRAVKCVVMALRSQSQPEKKAASRTEEESSLFHNAVSQAARKICTLPSRQ